MYPLCYWMLMLVVTAVATPVGLFGRRRLTSHWHTERRREGVRPEPVTPIAGVGGSARAPIPGVGGSARAPVAGVGGSGHLRGAGLKRLSTDQTLAVLARVPTRYMELTWFISATRVPTSDALGARWGDLRDGADGQAVAMLGKGGRLFGKRRGVPLARDVLQVLAARRELAASGDRDLIFPGPGGERMSSDEYRREIFRPAARAAGANWATPQTLRRLPATMMADLREAPGLLALEQAALSVVAAPALDEPRGGAATLPVAR
jgi:integrase